MFTEYDPTLPCIEFAVASLLTKCVYDKQTHKRVLKILQHPIQLFFKGCHQGVAIWLQKIVATTTKNANFAGSTSSIIYVRQCSTKGLACSFKFFQAMI